MRSSRSARPTGADTRTTTDADGRERALAGVGYPAPPWRLAGPAALLLTLVDVDRARRFVPDDLDIVEVGRGRTIGGVVFGDYGPGASFPYAELSVMPALVRCRGRRGAWISAIWVDSVASLKGGRDMWGMDKDLARFDRRYGDRNEVVVSDAQRRLATLRWRTPARTWPAPGWIRGIGSVAGDRRSFTGRGVSRLARVDLALDVPEDSPVAGLDLHRGPSLGLAGRMSLRFGSIRILSPPRLSTGTLGE